MSDVAAFVLGLSFMIGCFMLAVGIESCGTNAARIFKGLDT